MFSAVADVTRGRSTRNGFGSSSVGSPSTSRRNNRPVPTESPIPAPSCPVACHSHGTRGSAPITRKAFPFRPAWLGVRRHARPVASAGPPYPEKSDRKRRVSHRTGRSARQAHPAPQSSGPGRGAPTGTGRGAVRTGTAPPPGPGRGHRPVRGARDAGVAARGARAARAARRGGCRGPAQPAQAGRPAGRRTGGGRARAPRGGAGRGRGGR